MTSRLLATWLLLVGFIWLLIAVWVLIVMSGISTPAVAVFLLLITYFAGPVALVVGSVFVITQRYSRIGVLLAFLACAWLTWMIGSDLWPRVPENDAVAPMQYDWLSVALALIVVTSDAAVITMWRAHQTPTEFLFSYGTLQLEGVQMATFGRLLTGTSDALLKFEQVPLKIEDQAVIAVSGKAEHTIAKFTGRASDIISGTVFGLTPDEIQKADQYEVDACKRIAVILQSGVRAWVYVDAQYIP